MHIVAIVIIMLKTAYFLFNIATTFANRYYLISNKKRIVVAINSD